MGQRVVQHRFDSGWLDHYLRGRTDHDKYFGGCLVMENFLPLPTGAAMRRPGTYFIRAVKELVESWTNSGSVPYETFLSTGTAITSAINLSGGGQAYCNIGPVTAGETYHITYALTLNSGEAPAFNASAAGNTPPYNVSRLSTAGLNDFTYTAATTRANEYITWVNTAPANWSIKNFTIERVGNTRRLIPFSYSTIQSYCIEAGSLYFRFYKNHGQIQSGSPLAPVEISTPYTTAMLNTLQWAQTANIMYIVHPQVAPYKLTRTSDTAWTLTKVTFVDGPYLDQNTDTTKTLTPSGLTGSSITITASGHTPFASTDVGRYVRILHGTVWGYAQITGYTSSTVVIASVKKNFGATTASSAWRLGAWSDTTGYPSCVQFYENRLVFADNTANPQTIWGSKTNSYEDFTPGVLDNDPAVYTIATSDVNSIQWMIAGKTLIIGTTGGIFQMSGSSADTPLTPSNVQVKRKVSQGACSIPGLPVGDQVLYIDRAQKRIHEFAYRFESDSFVAPDLTLLTKTITEGTPKFQGMVYQQVPQSILWCYTDVSPFLYSLTYDRLNNVVAWASHPMGGGGQVESMAIVPSSTEDELWMIVKRTISGNTRRYIEYLKYTYQGATRPIKTNSGLPISQTNLGDRVFLDACLTYDGYPSYAQTITGLGHLEGIQVNVLADGQVHPAVTVVDGSVTLNYSVYMAQVGLGYGSTLETMPLALPGQQSLGMNVQVNEIMVQLYQSMNGTLGTVPGPANDAISYGDQTNKTSWAFTGWRTLTAPVASPDQSMSTVVAISYDPLPFTLLALVSKADFTEQL